MPTKNDNVWNNDAVMSKLKYAESTPEPDPVLYVLMRKDVAALTPAKMMVQAMHGTNSFIHFMEKSQNSIGPIIPGLYEKWVSEADGFGTIVLLESTEARINKLCDLAKDESLIYVKKIVDPTFPFTMDKALIPYFDFDDSNTNPSYEIDDRGIAHMTRVMMTCAVMFYDRNKHDLLARESRLRL